MPTKRTQNLTLKNQCNKIMEQNINGMLVLKKKERNQHQKEKKDNRDAQ